MADNSRVAIVTDSTADLPPDLRARLGITMVPLNVQLGDETWRDKVDLSHEEFMTLLASTDAIPLTSRPTAASFEATFRELATHHEAIVCVLSSSRLSGTIDSARTAAGAVGDTIRVEIVDSLNASLGCGFQALHAHRLAGEGLDAAAIAERLRSQVDRYHVIFFVESLDQLRRGGRVGKAASMVGSVLRLKPLLRIDEGQVVPFERARTRRKAIDDLVAFAENLPGIERIAALHNTTPGDAGHLYQRVAHLASQDFEGKVTTFGPVLGTHVGPGTLGLAVEVAANA